MSASAGNAPAATPAEVDPFDSNSEARYDAFATLRARGPAHTVPSGQRFFVHRSAVEQGLKSVDHFVGSFGDVGQSKEEDTLLAAIAEPRHGKIRKLFNSALAYNHASQVEPFTRRYAEARLDDALAECRRAGGTEIMEAFARRIPSAVIAEVLGIPNDRIDDFARWSDEVLQRQSQADGINAPIADLHPEFSSYLEARIDERIAAADPPNDMITRLLRAEVDGERLSRRAVLTQTIFLIVAGNETTRNLLGNLIHRLAEVPERYAALRANRELVANAIEESLRFDSPVQLLARTCTKKIEVGGVRVNPGERVLYSIASANRDERCFPDPDTFRLDRPRPRDHVAFGAGPHVCPGAFLARMEARVALETLLDRVARIELAPGHAFDPNPVFWALGPRTLRVRLIEEGS
ncbi:MAG: cytochrome P450 [Deltaproteobacteria bacterium]|nr:cytochrome P450 [Deltaproteobacteria bacterium]